MVMVDHWFWCISSRGSVYLYLLLSSSSHTALCRQLYVVLYVLLLFLSANTCILYSSFVCLFVCLMLFLLLSVFVSSGRCTWVFQVIPHTPLTGRAHLLGSYNLCLCCFDRARYIFPFLLSSILLLCLSSSSPSSAMVLVYTPLLCCVILLCLLVTRSINLHYWTFVASANKW